VKEADMNKRFSFVVKIVIGLALAVGVSVTAFGEDFYKGKTIHFIVGYSPGGGYDAYTRLIARHITRHIAGNPTAVVQNMTGAGSLVAANFTYNRAKPDGLTVGVWNTQNLFNQAMGDKRVRLDGRKMGWIGSPGGESVVCAIMGFAGLKTFQDILNSEKPVKLGATRGGNTVHLPKILNKWVGTKFKIITGYAGTAPIRLAMQSREVDGLCWVWKSMRTTARSLLDAKGDDKLIPFIIHGRWNEPEVKDIPLFSEVIKGEDNLTAYNIWNAPNEFARPLSLPPGTPKERIGILRKAFKATMEDPDFLADAKRSKLIVEYVSGEKVDELVNRIYSMPPRIKENLEFLMRKQKKS
jgi:tripartite-type tricarboxylate transporter receptor subunit TctC